MKKQLKKTINVIVAIILIVLVVLVISEYKMRADIEDKYRNVKSLINVGMDIDEAAKILQENGFRVGEKYSPTKKHDYYQVDIPLTEKVPLSATIQEITGLKIGGRGFVILIGNLDNKIIAIE